MRNFLVVLVVAPCALSCGMPPKQWDAPPEDGGLPDADADSEEDTGLPDADGDSRPDAELDGDVDAALDGDAEGDSSLEDAEADGPSDLCDGVLCFPDETCDPATGQCTSDGLDCGEIAGCWFDQNLDLTALGTCLMAGSAEGRRDFGALLACLLQNCMEEVLAGQDGMMGLGMCALQSCPGELSPCASGFF